MVNTLFTTFIQFNLNNGINLMTNCNPDSMAPICPIPHFHRLDEVHRRLPVLVHPHRPSCPMAETQNVADAMTEGDSDTDTKNPISSSSSSSSSSDYEGAERSKLVELEKELETNPSDYDTHVHVGYLHPITFCILFCFLFLLLFIELVEVL